MTEYEGLKKARALLLRHKLKQGKDMLRKIDNPSADTIMAVEAKDRDTMLGWIDGRLRGYEG